MALTTRITLTRRDTARPDDPEDVFGTSLSFLFPGQDVTNLRTSQSAELFPIRATTPIRQG
jgi:hypothetical protein